LITRNIDDFALLNFAPGIREKSIKLKVLILFCRDLMLLNLNEEINMDQTKGNGPE
jgi:hypothetical protein